jgi:membrane fusion protein
VNRPFYRREVLEARRQGWLGGISLSQPLRWWVLAAVSGALAIAVLCLLFFGTYTQRSKVAGQLVPHLGLSSVVAPGNGVVARVIPEEGAQVRAGQPLALIDVPRATADGTDARMAMRDGLDARADTTRALGESEVQQVDAQMAGTLAQLQAARQELRQIDVEIATRRDQERIGTETVDRYQRVAEQRYVSQVQLNQQRQSLLEMKNARLVLERQVTQLRRTVAQLEQSLRELPARRRGLQASSRRELATLAQERIQEESNGQLLLKAPVAGLVAARLAEPGESVQGGQVLLSLLPAGSHLLAQLQVPSRAIGFIELGDRVQLRYQAYPYQKFGHHGGRIVRISRSVVTLPGAPAGGPAREPMYRVLVALDRQSILAYGEPEPLRPGMLLDADILGERRRLYEWVLEPLYSVKGRLSGD